MGNKDNFLGMPYGTANHRLRKQLLFKYVKRAGEHFCHKCGFEIESVDDLSIEHIEPWENRSVDLFWDLDNIAFSHLKCNKPHRYKQPVDRSQGDMLRCGCCKTFKPKTRFVRNKSRFDGYSNDCYDCRNIRKRDRYARGLTP